MNIRIPTMEEGIIIEITIQLHELKKHLDEKIQELETAGFQAAYIILNTALGTFLCSALRKMHESEYTYLQGLGFSFLVDKLYYYTAEVLYSPSVNVKTPIVC